jgi:chorismate-pyruvate lyase
MMGRKERLEPCAERDATVRGTAMNRIIARRKRHVIRSSALLQVSEASLSPRVVQASFLSTNCNC